MAIIRIKDVNGWINQLVLLYGLTPGWIVTFSVPFFLQQDIKGTGSISLRTKYRFPGGIIKAPVNRPHYMAGLQPISAQNLWC